MDELDHQGDNDPKPRAESDEVPQRGKAENENRGTANGEQEADKPSTHGKLVHIDTGVTIFGHRHLLHHIIPLIGLRLKGSLA